MRTRDKDRESKLRWVKNNPEKRLQASHKYARSFKGRAARKKHYDENKSRILATNKLWAKNHPDETKAMKVRWSQRNLEKVRKSSRESNRRNAPRILLRQKSRYDNDPVFKLLMIQRVRIRRALNGVMKLARTIELVGCSGDEFRKHIESQFKSGMSWKNYGRKGWHIDHIRPCASFNLRDPSQQRECFHYSNLQPLWAIENIRKGKHLHNF